MKTEAAQKGGSGQRWSYTLALWEFAYNIRVLRGSKYAAYFFSFLFCFLQDSLLSIKESRKV